MDSDVIFEKNLKRWSLFCPEAAKKISQLKCKEVSFIQNSNGQLNLQKKKGEENYLVYTQEDIQQEAKEWFEKLNLINVQVLYVYGLGLGYYYEAVCEWLKKNKDHFIVFLEDDPEVLHLFLRTELATKILNDKKAFIFFLDWNKIHPCLDEATINFPFKNYKILALKSYLQRNSQEFREIESKIAYSVHLRDGELIEYLLQGNPYYQNFYKNLLEISKAKQAALLYDKFENVPAIICGAGPSLEKNLALLGTLKDRALIFAGGTAMNALNAQGVLPHFGVGIDPHAFHFTRLISNQAFEVPFFYRNRMYYEAVQAINGPHIYVNGAGCYNLPLWFEKELNIPSDQILVEGFNVINFSLSIAKALGCNPIIFVGVDLAYSNNQSYSSGIKNHAIHDPKRDFRTKTASEELIVKKDVNGQPVYTLWKWLLESTFFSVFAGENNKLSLYNCTEGGIGFKNIPNKTLKWAADSLLQKQYDFNGWIHTELQNAAMPPDLTDEKVIEKIEELAKSIKKSQNLMISMLSEYQKIFGEVQSGKSAPCDLKDEILDQYTQELHQEVAYEYLLKLFDGNFKQLFPLQFKTLEYEKDLMSEVECLVSKIAVKFKHYDYLLTITKNNLGYIDEALNIAAERKTFISKSLSPEFLKLTEQLKVEREKEEERMEKSTSEKSLFHNKEGVLLAKSEYVNGIQEGLSWLYYTSGHLYSLQRFKVGKWHGRQEFYHPNGLPKTILHYTEGLLDGEVKLFYPDGRIKREINYLNGKREGEDHIYSEGGVMMIEAEYKDDKPFGTAREWYSNGNLAKEIIYDPNNNKAIIRRWEMNGAPLAPEMLVNEDYFDKITRKTELLTESLKNVFEKVKEVMKLIPGETEKQADQLNFLKSEIEKLSKISKEIVFESGLDPNNPQEAIWKSESNQRNIQKMVETISKEMQNNILNMQKTISEIQKKNSL